MTGQFHERLHYVFTIGPAIGGIVIWAIFIALYSDIDAVSIYTFERKLLKINEVFTDDSSKDNTYKSLKASINLIDECVFPDVYNLVTSNKNMTPSQIIQSNGISEVESAKFYNKWSLINFDSWKKERSAISLPYTDLDSTSPVFNATTRFSPVCRCVHAVFKKYKAIPGTPFNTARNAAMSCLATRYQIPRQTVLFGSGPDDQNVANRKCVSRTAFVLIMSLAMLGNLFYRNLSFQETVTGFWNTNIMNMVGIIILLLLTWFLPLVNLSLNQANLLAFHTIAIIPGLVIIAGVEYVWILNGNDIRRQVYTHPFCFFVMLMSLYALALLENGVFTLDVLMSFYWLSVTTACVYAAVIFCSLNKVWENESSRSGYFLLLFVSCIAVAIKLVPTFPVNCSLNILWMAPVFYAGIHFFGIILSEQISGVIPPNDKSFVRSAYYISMGQSLIFMFVIFHFADKLQFLSMGETSLKNANMVPSKPNFELYTFRGRFYGS